MDNPILSICIPTYNRATYLEATLNSIVSQKRFQETSDVEIVISDNCSDDNTCEVAAKYVKIYSDKIRYSRNSENIKDANFEKALSYGKGVFLKLNNDTQKHLDMSIEKILQTIEENKQEKNILFFSNKVLKIEQNTLYKDLNSFIESVSYWSGWIAAFGIWKEDFMKLSDFNRCVHLQLAQVDVLFRLINSRKAAFVNNDEIFNIQALSRKGGYDVITVFLDNYILLLSEQLNNKTLIKETFISEKRKLLLKFIRPMLVTVKINPNEYYFEHKNSFRRINSYYRTDKITLIRFYVYYGLSLCYFFSKK